MINDEVFSSCYDISFFKKRVDWALRGSQRIGSSYDDADVYPLKWSGLSWQTATTLDGYGLPEKPSALRDAGDKFIKIYRIYIGNKVTLTALN